MPKGVDHKPGGEHEIILLGCDPPLRQALEPLLGARGARVSAEHPSLSAPSLGSGEPALVIARVRSAETGQLAQLCGALAGRPVLALLDCAGADLANAVIAAMRAGAAQVVPLPLRADDFLAALDALAVQFPRRRRGAVIAVCGVTGGCGATTLALNLAAELAGPPLPPPSAGVLGPGIQGVQPGSKHQGPGARPDTQHWAGDTSHDPQCVLVELARQIGTLSAFLNVEPELSSYEVLADASLLTLPGLRRSLTHTAAGIDVLVGPFRDIGQATTHPTRHVFRLIDLCRKLAPFTVLDVPCTFDDQQFATLAAVDRVVLVGVQTVSSVRTLKLVRDTLEREEGVQGQVLVINQYDPHVPGFAAERLVELLQDRRVLTVANDYPSVMAAVAHGLPLRQAVPHSRALADLRVLARRLQDVPEEAGAEEAPAAGTGPPSSYSGPGIPLGPLSRKVRVLHVEDDPVQRDVLALHLLGVKDLVGLECEVTWVVSETEAVETFRSALPSPARRFDVVLLDFHLAQGNGLSCLRRLRQMDELVPILAISGLARPQVAAELLEAGADDFVSKENLSPERLARGLREAVARSEACRQRLGPGEGLALDHAVQQIRRAVSASSDTELVRCLSELQSSPWPAHFTTGQIQRLVDLVTGELEKAAPERGSEARAATARALLGLFLRLFGGG